MLKIALFVVACLSIAAAQGLIAVNVAATCGTSCDGSASRPYTTIAAAVAAAPSGSTISVLPGNYPASAISIAGKQLTLRSTAGRGRTSFIGDNTTRLFALTAGANVTFQGFGFQRGRATGNGGALNIAASTAYILNSAFLYNSASSEGGAILGGSLANIWVTGTSFENNRAGNNGGAICAGSGATFRISKCYFARNTAGGDGGALKSIRSNYYVSQSNFENNVAAQRAVISITGDGTNRVELSDNDGIFYNIGSNNGIFFACSGATVTIADLKQEPLAQLSRQDGTCNVTSSTTGSPIFFANPNATTVWVSVFTSADGIANGADGSMERPFLSVADALAQTSGELDVLILPGEHVVQSVAISARNVTIRGCGSSLTVVTAQSRAQPFTIANSRVIFTSLTVRDGVAEGNGGAFRAAGASSVVYVVDSVFTYNYASGEGGAILIAQGASLTVWGTQLEDNEAGANGGAICAGGANLITVRSSIFQRNIAGVNGGAVKSFGSPVAIYGSSFSENSAVKGDAVSVTGPTQALFADANRGRIDFDCTSATVSVVNSDSFLLGQSSVCSSCNITDLTTNMAVPCFSGQLIRYGLFNDSNCQNALSAVQTVAPGQCVRAPVSSFGWFAADIVTETAVNGRFFADSRCATGVRVTLPFENGQCIGVAGTPNFFRVDYVLIDQPQPI